MTKFRTALIVSTVLLAACSGLKIPGINPFKMDVRQGNFVTQDMRDKLEIGMSKQQIQNLLGTPMINDAFHGNRWDYVYSLQKQGQEVEKQRLALYFEDDKLARIDDNGRAIGDDPMVVASAPTEISLDSIPFEGQPQVAQNDAPKEISLDNIPQEDQGSSQTETARQPEPTTVATLPPAEPEPEATPRAEPPRSKPEPVITASTEGKSDVAQSIQSWVNAWTSRNIPQYLASYSGNFKPAGMSKSAWEAQRKQRIGKARAIDVSINDMVITMRDDSSAIATFKQDYRSDNYRDSVYKKLALQKEGSHWVILAEQELKRRPATEASEERVAQSDTPSTSSKSSNSTGSSTTDEIVQRLEHWGSAWAARDVDGYLANYADSFKPNGMGKSAWEAQRKQRISRAKVINLNLTAVNIRVIDDSHANVNFKQHYRSDSYRDQTDKTLQLQKFGNDWLIVAEVERNR